MNEHTDFVNIDINALLIYPPGGASDNIIFSNGITPLGIPMLRAYLNKMQYKGLKVLDLSITETSKLIIFLRNYLFSFMRILFISDIILFIMSFNTLKKLISKFLLKKRKNNHFISLNELLNSVNKDEDFNEIALKTIRELIEKEDTDIVGFSVVYPKQIKQAILASKYIKSIRRDIVIVFGGPQITKHIKYLTKNEFITNFVDAFIVNDGEVPFAELIYQVNHSRDFSKVSNLYYLKNEKYVQSDMFFTADSDFFILPDFDDMYLYTTLPIRASYGCLWSRCTFCTYRLFHKTYVYADVDVLINNIKSLIDKYGIRSFLIIDDFLSPEYLKKFSEAIIRSNIKIKWSSFVALLPGFDRNTAEMMAKSGCRRVSIGLESMSKRILKLMQKPQHTVDLKMVNEIAELFNKYAIKVDINVIFGFPTETENEANITLDFLKKNVHLFDKITIQQFALEENTIIFNKHEKYGIKKVFTKDKDYGLRLGFRYEVESGMTQDQSRLFTENAIKSLPLKARNMIN